VIQAVLPARGETAPGFYVQIDYQPARFAKCSASECMAWRWSSGGVRGYCGLVGHD